MMKKCAFPPKLEAETREHPKHAFVSSVSVKKFLLVKITRKNTNVLNIHIFSFESPVRERAEVVTSDTTLTVFVQLKYCVNTNSQGYLLFVGMTILSTERWVRCFCRTALVIWELPSSSQSRIEHAPFRLHCKPLCPQVSSNHLTG